MNIINNVNDFYEMNDADKEIYVNEVTQEILSSDNEVLNKMLKAVNRTVKRFQTDFIVHDVKYLIENANDDMVWIIRDNGTHLLKLKLDTENDRTEQQNHYEYILRTHRNNPSIKTYFVNMKNNKIRKTDKIEFTCNNQYNY